MFKYFSFFSYYPIVTSHSIFSSQVIQITVKDISQKRGIKFTRHCSQNFVSSLGKIRTSDRGKITGYTRTHIYIYTHKYIQE